MEIEGLFWPVDPPKRQERRQPPAPTWLSPEYLPGLAEALANQPPRLTPTEAFGQLRLGSTLLCDVELFPNYFLVSFCSYDTGAVWFVEADESTLFQLSLRDRQSLYWVLHNFEVVTFNGRNYDIPIITLALQGATLEELFHASSCLIYQGIKPWTLLQTWKVEELEINHIDLIEVCPLSSSLKIYGGRLHVPKMQDLPFPFDTELSPDQIAIIRYYNINDLTTTAFLLAGLQDQIRIRREMSGKYNIDLRSKSDAQIAEAVIKEEFRRLNGINPKAPEIPPGTSYVYNVPLWLSFQTPAMQSALEAVRRARFFVGDSGAVEMPSELAGLKIPFGKSVYKMGIGGLHSTEETVSYLSNDQFKIVDRDVASYYPAIILNQQLYPLHLGRDFLTVYQSLVTRRLEAKKTGNKVEAETLKIVINGSFGKFGNRYSALYAPDLLFQVTVTGQLALLMLIERLELAGVQVCSANTDGLVMRFPRAFESTVSAVVAEWERVTGFTTEETEYSAIYCRDVNNYIAIKPGGGTKTKGRYNLPEGIFRFHKNPEAGICVDAAINFLVAGVDPSETIRACRDIRRFVIVRKVKGGAVKDGEYLGKAVRWYYGKNTGGEIVYCSTGNKVPKSEGAKPCLELPKEFPNDIDYFRYELETQNILKEINAIKTASLNE